MRRVNQFNPASYIVAGCEDEDRVEPLQMAYHIKESIMDSLEPISDDDGMAELQEQIALMNGHTRRAEDLAVIEQRLVSQGKVRAQDLVELETKFPEIKLTPNYTGVESFDIYAGTYPLAPALEAAKTLKSGLMFVGIIAIVRFVLGWLGGSNTASAPLNTGAINEGTGLLNQALAATDKNLLPTIFQEYDRATGDNPEKPKKTTEDKPDDSAGVAEQAGQKLDELKDKTVNTVKDKIQELAANHPEKISAAIRTMTKKNITKAEVKLLFADGDISLPKVLKYRADVKSQILTAPVFATAEGYDILKRDAEFLQDASAKNQLNAFVSSLVKIKDTHMSWITAIEDGGGHDAEGNVVSAEAPLPEIDNTFVVNASKKLGWSLTQPLTNGNKIVLQKLDSDDMKKQGDLYQPLTADKVTVKDLDLSHFNDIEKYAATLNIVNKEIPEWKKILDKHNKGLQALVKSMQEQSKIINAREGNYKREKVNKAVNLMSAHVNSGFNNFKCILVWLSSIDKCKQSLYSVIVDIQKGQEKLTALLSSYATQADTAQTAPAEESKAEETKAD